MAMDDATRRQNQAADPNASTWLSANAGSGKTRVLTDRVARLLLEQVKPQNILCLTYTKAAASEMQNRLFQRLGNWAMKPDADLAAELAALGVTGFEDAERLAFARQLFARAIETPGGLRIQTIHSFCASLLRRFPLEAGVTPNFSEMDDRAAALLREEIIEELADGGDVAAIDGLARFISDGDALENLARGVVQNRGRLSREVSRRDICGWFGLPDGAGEQTIIDTAFDGSEPALVQHLLPISQTQSKSYKQFGETLAALRLAEPDRETFDALCGVFLYASGDRRHESKSINFPQSNHKKAVEAFAPILDDLHEFMDRIAAAKQVEICLPAAERTEALYRFANAFLPAYEARKLRRGWLDFDDLIERTGALLGNGAVAAWVLYRLDGGLDHILVDEAQDTSPAQWQVIKRLAQEFTAGQGARDDVERTIFVVGDKKQSIYSFQGADPSEFDRMQQHFSDRLAAAERAMRPMELEYSFRSSEAVMRFVDQTITISDTGHKAFRDQLPGRVDLWPAVPKPETPQRQNWFDPVDIQAENSEVVILAQEIAGRIKSIITSETIPLPNGTRRPISAGDIMILVRSRSALFAEIIRACKSCDLPIAGADRLKLGAELAVKDIAALLSFLATDQDDLSLAAALRSPLFGWTEAELYDLAAKRSEPLLWASLRNRAEEFPETHAILTDLRNNADFLRPHDLIERILTRHDGRRRLLARLGPEAEDGIDVLLAQSLAFERSEVPSLTGFLTWLETDDIDVKRQMDGAGDLIRVMTVHGAKGLESPIVILPDTAKRPTKIRDDIIDLDDGKLIWKMPAEQQPMSVKSALIRLKTAQEEEDERLYYVAATRAETWLIFAAAGEAGTDGDSWHARAEAGLRQLGATALQTPVGEGLRYAHLDWSGGSVAVAKTAPVQQVDLPDWVARKAKAAARSAPTRAPSDLGGAKALSGPGGLTEEAALRHGRRVHHLLELLPEVPRTDWADHAQRLFASGENVGSAAEIATALTEAAAVIEAPELKNLFGADVLNEVDVSANLPELQGGRIAGAIDKLIITPDRILAVDFKTNAVIPRAPAEVPDGILRQLGAYHSALQQIFPGHQVDSAVLWTRAPLLMPVPHDIVRAALLQTATS